MVDDVLDQLDLYAMVLEPHVEVSRASRGEMAIAMALAHPPDVIVLDLLLPDVDGFDVCRRLRGVSETAAIPIIFLTGDEASLFKAMSSPEFASVFAILKKPATGDRLLTAIRAALAGSRQG
jgi:two-component system cell cycle response regulator